jgi:hypothetical protein
VEQRTAEKLDIGMCLTSSIFEGRQRWRNRTFFGHSKLFKLPLSCLA